jgi:hypothetical protein
VWAEEVPLLGNYEAMPLEERLGCQAGISCQGNRPALSGEGDHRCEERRSDPVPAEIGIHEQHVDIAVVIQVGEPGHVAIDDGQLCARCCPGRGPHS